jgi:pimeloyl-ACP methyl ester carboxylesterase/DNA-binding CsgD family transcriptional regulator
MDNASFSSLIYRIIGKPERWHDEYIVEMMQEYLDETDSVDDPTNFGELAAGDKILEALRQGNVALNAFDSLLNKSRFQMIILDDQLKTVYHNQSSNDLLAYLADKNGSNRLKPEFSALIKKAPRSKAGNENNAIISLDLLDQNGDQVYLRSINSNVRQSGVPTLFHILMVIDKAYENQHLNAELVALYELTKKEQSILQNLIHGKSVKEIAVESFTAENTVRSHLKSLFRKTETNSQGALISLILTHESRVLDSYFDSDITTAVSNAASDNDRELRLASGHTIAYCDYGPKDGRPIIVFHSGFGSRLAIPPNYQEICERTNRRLIVPDRPGLGKTAFIEGHPDQWNQQLEEFIDLLGIDEYDVLGSIISSQIAMNYAYQANDRLQKVILTSPVFLNKKEHTAYLTEILAPAARYVRLSPTFAKEIYELWLKSVTLNLDGHYPSILHDSIGSAEREMFEQHGVIQLLTDVFKEGARQSLDGILHEMAFCMTPLNLDMHKFNKPIEVWFGTEDKRITREGVETIFSQLPNCKLNIREGYSEHLYYALLEEIIA